MTHGEKGKGKSRFVVGVDSFFIKVVVVVADGRTDTYDGGFCSLWEVLGGSV